MYTTKKLPNLVAKILATKFGFVPDCLLQVFHSAFYVGDGNHIDG